MKEKRQYVRMNTVFPVEFSVVSGDGEKLSDGLLQGFTRDVSAGGMCVELKSFGKEAEKVLLAPHAALELVINPPFTKNPIHAEARIIWIKKQETPLPARYLIGTQYIRIDSKAKRRIIRYAKRLLWVPRLAVVFGLLMLGAILTLFFYDQKLYSENRKLVNQIVLSAEKRSEFSSKLVAIQTAKRKLSVDLYEAQKKINRLQEKMSGIEGTKASLRQSYQKEVDDNLTIQKSLEEKLKNIEAREARLESSYKTFQQSEKLTASAALRQMYDWLKSHQNLRTGILASFEGDPSLENTAFTYDQALACQVFLLFGDTANAEMILSFYDKTAAREEGIFFNAYSTMDGSSTENVIHTGPNVWIGISAAQYEARMKNGRYLGLARGIADWLISFQDDEGGVRGGPAYTWYSTEHNLDTYSFLGMMAEITGEARYKEAQARSLAWIKKYAYSLVERRMNRGKGDSTIATDTFSWAITALGPKVLSENGFDPEAIMDFAESNCRVTVEYKKPNGKLTTATGFDFARAQNLGRGGVISTEWTSQVIVAYQALVDYFEAVGDSARTALYRDKAEYYLSELQKMIITSPSKTGQGRGCLPYASADNADTGHGWRTPGGSRTGSVAGTAYGIFAWTGYNPFNLHHLKKIES